MTDAEQAELESLRAAIAKIGLMLLDHNCQGAANEKELRALALVAQECARCSREDISGVLLGTSGTQILTEEELLNLARKLEAYNANPKG